MKITSILTERDAIVYNDNIEDNVIDQITDFLESPMTDGEQVRIMSDVHLGSGCVIGYTQTYSGGPIDPQALGCDLSCGMINVILKLKKPLDLELIDHRIRKAVPMGQELQEHSMVDEKDFRKFLKTKLEKARALWPEFIKYEGLGEIDKFIQITIKRLGIDTGVFWKSLGTLGSGNHFIELGRPEGETDETIYHLTIHTGSRNLGIKVLSHWSKHISSTRIIKETMKLKKAEIREKYKYDRGKIAGEIQKLMFDPECAILPSRYIETQEDLSGYLGDVYFADAYAEYNRSLIVEAIKTALKATELSRIVSIHNTIDLTDKIIRKGATPANEDQKVIIPINMAFGVIIGTGLGNSDWNYSAPHGAGRRLSRGGARRYLNLEEFKESMKDVFSTSVSENTIDEAPAAYKDPESIVSLIDGETIKIDYIIKPLISIKA